jgi:hypothetical protein
VGNINLIRVPPGIAGTITSIAMQAALTEISAKFEMVITIVDNLSELVRLANQGILQGAIHSLEVAKQINDKDHRRRQMLQACQEIQVQLGLVAAQMAAHVK